MKSCSGYLTLSFFDPEGRQRRSSPRQRLVLVYSTPYAYASTRCRSESSATGMLLSNGTLLGDVLDLSKVYLSFSFEVSEAYAKPGGHPFSHIVDDILFIHASPRMLVEIG